MCGNTDWLDDWCLRANQTNNTLCNYVNRSGAAIDTSQIVQAYGLAVGVACGIGLSLSKLVERGPPFLKRLGPLVPFTAVVAAGAANLTLTRYPEVQKGVPVSTVDGTPLGQSPKAAIEVICDSRHTYSTS